MGVATALGALGSAAVIGAGTLAWATSHGIPPLAALAYERAVAAQPAGCAITVAQLAGFGAVESGHGTHGGASIQPDGMVTPRVVGPALDGVEFALIWDTDGGAYDGDATYDRAVGPMQFIPESWAATMPEGGDPHNYFDATRAAVRYLCQYGPLNQPDRWEAAVLAYNRDRDYLAAVSERAEAYAGGAPTVAAGSQPTASPAVPTGGQAASAGEIADRIAGRAVGGWDRVGQIVDRPDTPTLRRLWAAVDRTVSPIVRDEGGAAPPSSPAPAQPATTSDGGYCAPEGVDGLAPPFAGALDRLIGAAAAAGHPGITITSACRTAETQASLWATALQRYGSADAARQWVAPAGRNADGTWWSGSNHSTGTAADLGWPDDATMAWAHANGRRLGVCFPLADGTRGTNEDWHAEPC